MVYRLPSADQRSWLENYGWDGGQATVKHGTKRRPFLYNSTCHIPIPIPIPLVTGQAAGDQSAGHTFGGRTHWADRLVCYPAKVARLPDRLAQRLIVRRKDKDTSKSSVGLQILAVPEIVCSFSTLTERWNEWTESMATKIPKDNNNKQHLLFPKHQNIILIYLCVWCVILCIIQSMSN